MRVGKKSKQQFFRGHRVHIHANKIPRSMEHFDSGLDAIVMGSYSDMYTGHRGVHDHSYQLALIKKGRIYNTSAWYDEYQLSLVDADRDRGEAMLQKYKEKL